ncbi:MAG: UDP-N-acetylglucosamine 1-carboxyvinyltransferase [Candidatus Lambdaproteobacteria bacterium RIFOXYD1_FULL_56_27]|uniref:UDP-N-acetylglucosamine 1-carboxyvinyltransferase n=1 Tax=Candidatus Lambdaproteobacteria bacterium RIFOXYD2_FULL_56_26 TaxID=1817773 RepID=A0A1F6GMX8_9PROT|nr:MAG: UDP-N-acetylglucosamine 1-carboxyvinyltransferase [Candidatus Lambdaproteobacteria bacterium RIFOXYD2_FULL_56_26]OGH05656.1 MAG: UDP-N-acetylglucosamine 1-carboxyvinyltransferase [Candidatus Lambdaproteobacteria bacterium RIFOXYC1_FULL_56_13]OGH08621.1 MAG: UDP-N-acetylglucosamine 1-carboxyvinyltransferase [Candidatus Lambdaproteobacteria bacterium RIFOXYD1_FULL_56_27]
MEKFIVKGGNPLKGSIRPSGNKNEALPVLAAVLLTDQPILIHNLPHIGDIIKMKEILEGLGVSISYKGESSYQFDASNLLSFEPAKELAQAIRGSFLLAAPLAYRMGKAKIFEPGGDSIGKRRLDTHVHALEQLGLKFSRKAGYHQVVNQGLKGADLLLDEASVMATEHLIMAAVLAKGTTRVYHAACEPHVQGLCRMLNLMGAKIGGLGSNLLTIEGVPHLGGCEYRIQPDHTEVGSLIGLAAVTKSEILIQDAGWEHLGQIRSYFRRLGVEFVKQGKDDLLVPAKQKMIIQNDIDDSIPKIDDAPWPGFPADLTSIMTVVATQCKGTVLIFEKLFESRLFWVDKLIRMGAKIVLCDPHRAVVVGPARLKGMTLSSPDIRAGMALLIAALCAEGTSEIHNIGQIDRGYEAIDQRLGALGAEIQRV